MADPYSNENLYGTPAAKSGPKPIPGSPYDNSQLYQPAPARPQAEMRAAEYSPSQRFTNAIQDALIYAGAKPQTARHLAEGGTGLVGMTPMGSVLAGADLPYNVGHGNYGSAALDALGVIPGVTAARRIAQGLPRIRPAEVPPPWVQRGGPEDRGFVTPSTPELIGSPQAATPGQPAVGLLPATPATPAVPPGSAIASYNRIRNSPIQYDPLTGRDYQANVLAHLESPAGGAFSPASAPAAYDTIERHAALWENRNQPVPASYVDNLRSQLRNLPAGPDAVAGQRASRYLDQYLASPTPGAMLPHNPQDFAALRADLQQARGDYRAGKTAQTIENAIDRAGTRAGSTYSGMNVDNATRQRLETLQGADAVNDKLFAATPAERAAVTAASQGDWLGNTERSLGKLGGGGGGLGRVAATSAAFGAGGSLGHAMGLDPLTASAVATTAAGVPFFGGKALLRASNERTVGNAEAVADLIRRNSPEYAARVAATPEVIDPRVMARDAITYALLPQVRQQGEDPWAGAPASAYTPWDEPQGGP